MDPVDEERGGVVRFVEPGKKATTLYKLAVIEPEGHQIACFNGAGAVERDLIQAVTEAVLATLPATLGAAMDAQAYWWERSRVKDLQAACESAGRDAVVNALDALLLTIKQEALGKHFGAP